jgi:hypothetical protein
VPGQAVRGTVPSFGYGCRWCVTSRGSSALCEPRLRASQPTTQREPRSKRSLKLMIKFLFGVPFSKQTRKQFARVLQMRAGDASATLRDVDHFIEIVASRSGALLQVYAILAAIYGFAYEQAPTPRSNFLLGPLLIQLVAIALLVPCLWISWAKTPEVYTRVETELERSHTLLYRRSTLFNGSIVVAALAAALQALLVFRMFGPSPANLSSEQASSLLMESCVGLC